MTWWQPTGVFRRTDSHLYSALQWLVWGAAMLGFYVAYKIATGHGIYKRSNVEMLESLVSLKRGKGADFGPPGPRE